MSRSPGNRPRIGAWCASHRNGPLPARTRIREYGTCHGLLRMHRQWTPWPLRQRRPNAPRRQAICIRPSCETLSQWRRTPPGLPPHRCASGIPGDCRAGAAFDPGHADPVGYGTDIRFVWFSNFSARSIFLVSDTSVLVTDPARPTRARGLRDAVYGPFEWVRIQRAIEDREDRSRIVGALLARRGWRKHRWVASFRGCRLHGAPTSRVSGISGCRCFQRMAGAGWISEMRRYRQLRYRRALPADRPASGLGWRE